MIETTVEIVNERGMHARAASKFVKLANKYKSLIKIKKGSVEVDGKSILGLLLLQASKGTSITLKTDGEDEQEAMEAIKNLIANKFDESK